jgi:hypothetical protein
MIFELQSAAGGRKWLLANAELYEMDTSSEALKAQAAVGRILVGRRSRRRQL